MYHEVLSLLNSHLLTLGNAILCRKYLLFSVLVLMGRETAPYFGRKGFRTVTKKIIKTYLSIMKVKNLNLLICQTCIKR